MNDGVADSDEATVTLRVQHFPGAAWETRAPAQLGLDGAKLDELAARVGGVGSIVKDGYMVKTWGNQTAKADWGSARKPLLGTMLFFAAQEELIGGVGERIEEWVQVATSNELRPEDRDMTFWHLANMVSGYARAEAPGAAYAYNDYGTTLYGRLLEAIFGGPLDAPARTRLTPLQLQDGSLFTTRGGLGVSTSTRDFARIGWLWLNHGNWHGEQMLAEAFFEQHMSNQVPGSLPRSSAAGEDYLGVGSTGGSSDQTPFGPGIFGMAWWFNDTVGTTSSLAWPGAPIDTVHANGHFGKEMVVMIPSLNIVVAARGDWGSFEPGDPDSGINRNFDLLASAAR